MTSFTGAEDLANAEIRHKSEDYVEKNFYEKCLEWRTKLAAHLKIMRDEAHDGELAAFASYAIAFPDGFLALIDTYDVSRYRLEFTSVKQGRWNWGCRGCNEVIIYILSTKKTPQIYLVLGQIEPSGQYRNFLKFCKSILLLRVVSFILL